MRFVPCFLALLVLIILSNMGSAQEPRLEMDLQTGHTSPVGCVVVSPNGKYVLTGGSWDHTAILWEAASGRKLQTIQADGNILAVAMVGHAGRTMTSSHDQKSAEP